MFVWCPHITEQMMEIYIYIYLYIYIYVYIYVTGIDPRATVFRGHSSLQKIVLAVWEAVVSRYNRGPIKGPPWTSQYDRAVMAWGVSGDPQLAPLSWTALSLIGDVHLRFLYHAQVAQVSQCSLLGRHSQHQGFISHHLINWDASLSLDLWAGSSDLGWLKSSEIDLPETYTGSLA